MTHHESGYLSIKPVMTSTMKLLNMVACCRRSLSVIRTNWAPPWRGWGRRPARTAMCCFDFFTKSKTLCRIMPPIVTTISPM